MKFEEASNKLNELCAEALTELSDLIDSSSVFEANVIEKKLEKNTNEMLKVLNASMPFMNKQQGVKIRHIFGCFVLRTQAMTDDYYQSKKKIN